MINTSTRMKSLTLTPKSCLVGKVSGSVSISDRNQVIFWKHLAMSRPDLNSAAAYLICTNSIYQCHMMFWPHSVSVDKIGMFVSQFYPWTKFIIRVFQAFSISGDEGFRSENQSPIALLSFCLVVQDCYVEASEDYYEYRAITTQKLFLVCSRR